MKHKETMKHWDDFRTALKGEKKSEKIEKIARELGCTYRTVDAMTGKADIGLAAQNIYNYLQTNMMLNACISAKRSCFWAAIAAIAACISIVVMLCSK